MSNKKSFYETPETCFVELAGIESLLAVSAGATFSGVEEVDNDFVY